jgi:hypothetical protein
MSDTHRVHYDAASGGWWFWDETDADRYGPFATESAARMGLSLYAREALEGYGRMMVVAVPVVDGVPYIVYGTLLDSPRPCYEVYHGPSGERISPRQPLTVVPSETTIRELMVLHNW